jgi:serine/threonine-protein kinase ULK/ATG1
MFKVVGDYQLTEKIGKGNFADVYLGTNQKTGSRHAVKVISKETFSDPKLIAGLDAEIKIMKEFTHPNIVQLYKYFSSEKNYYLVLEFCAGGDLNKYIKKNGRLSENHSINFLFQLTEGLFFLHKKNFIHRDLKPANILLSEQSENAVLKLSDFGFARHLSQATLAQTRCGTPLYMVKKLFSCCFFNFIDTLCLLSIGPRDIRSPRLRQQSRCVELGLYLLRDVGGNLSFQRSQ